MDAALAESLKAVEMRVVMAIVGATALWSRLEDDLSIDQLANKAGVPGSIETRRKATKRALKRLVELGIVTYSPGVGRGNFSRVGLPQKGASTSPPSNDKKRGLAALPTEHTDAEKGGPLRARLHSGKGASTDPLSNDRKGGLSGTRKGGLYRPPTREVPRESQNPPQPPAELGEPLRKPRTPTPPPAPAPPSTKPRSSRPRALGTNPRAVGTNPRGAPPTLQPPRFGRFGNLTEPPEPAPWTNPPPDLRASLRRPRRAQGP